MAPPEEARMPECHGMNATDDEYYSYYLLRVCAAAVYVRERAVKKERKKDITYIHYVNSPPKMGHLDQDEFHSETTIYLSYLINPHKNGWFLRHFSAPRTCRRYCLAMPPMPLPNARIFYFSRLMVCRHNDIGDGSAEPLEAISSPARPAAEEPP